jgi:predicted phosphodiesterase
MGGVHSNVRALQAALDAAAARGIDRIYSLGDLVGLGPDSEAALALAEARGILSLPGEFEMNLEGGELGWDRGFPGDYSILTSVRDHAKKNLLAERAAKTASWPHLVRFRLGRHRVLLAHGSPAWIAEGCWESRQNVEYLGWFDENGADVIACDHTGLPWSREVAPGRWMVNVGSVGRPANDGRRAGTMAVLSEGEPPAIEFVPLQYDVDAVIARIRAEGLPEELWRTHEEGYWHFLFDPLPPLERARGRY